MFRAFAAFAAAVGFLGIAAAPVPAQTLSLPGSLTVGGTMYTWFGLSACSTAALCSNAQVVANVGNTGIELRPVTGNLVSAGQDLSVTIQIDSLTGAPINSYGLTTGGTTNGSSGANIYAADGFTQLTGTNAAAGGSSTVGIATSPPRTRIYANLDATGNSGSITFVGMTVTTVPEPATLAIFATGLAGLIGLRRRRAA